MQYFLFCTVSVVAGTRPFVTFIACLVNKFPPITPYLIRVSFYSSDGAFGNIFLQSSLSRQVVKERINDRNIKNERKAGTDY
jgi:hypothetical protein